MPEIKERITREKFYNEHVACPDCDNTRISVTLVGVIDWGDEDFFDGTNTAKCKCGWAGPIGDLLPEKEEEK